MSVDSVRRIDDGGVLQGERAGTIDEDEIEFWEIEERELEPEIEDYPWGDVQKRIIGFEYESEPLFGSPTTAEGSIEFRRRSGLSILKMDSDQPKPETIYRKLSELAGDTGEDEVRRIGASTEEIREFIDKADSWVDVQVLKPSGDVERVGREDESLLERYPIDRAKVQFQHPDEDTPSTVTYVNGQLQFNEASSKLREYVIEYLEYSLE